MIVNFFIYTFRKRGKKINTWYYILSHDIITDTVYFL